MPSLRETQERMLDALLTGELARAAPLVRRNGLAPARRLSVYRNNCLAVFLDVMESAYPVVRRLGGPDWFRQVVRAYQRAFPSRHGNLHHLGEGFPAFLATRLADGPWGWFADVARLEWAYQEVMVAAESPPLDLACLGAVAPGDYPAIVFELRPAVRLVTAGIPLLAIWRMNQPDAPPSGTPVSLADGPSRILLARRRDDVELRELPAGQYRVLEVFARGGTLAEAGDAAAAVEPGFDLGQALARLARLETLGGFRLAHPTTFNGEQRP